MPGRGHGTLVLFCSFKRLFQNLNEVVRMHQKNPCTLTLPSPKGRGF